MFTKRAHARARVSACTCVHTRACAFMHAYKKFKKWKFFFQKELQIFFRRARVWPARARTRTKKYILFFFLEKFFFKLFFFQFFVFFFAGPRSGLLTVTQMPFYGKNNYYSLQTMYFQILGCPLLGRPRLGRPLLGHRSSSRETRPKGGISC